MIGLYKDGTLKKTYTDAGKAAIALAMAKDIQPEHKWEIKRVTKKEVTL